MSQNSAHHVQASNVTRAGVKPGGQEYVFTQEIQQMMYGCGDCKRPLTETAHVIESILKRQLCILLQKCHEHAEIRESKEIGLEDFLFVIRHKEKRLKRFLSYIGPRDGSLSADPSQSKRRRRRQLCEEYLCSIDTAYGLMFSAEEHDNADELHMRRLQRAEIRSRNMDADEYMEFCKARQMNFLHGFRRQRFSEWIDSMSTSLSLKPNTAAHTALAFMAYETLAELVDMAMLVRHETEAVLDPEQLRSKMPAVVCNYPTIQPQGLQGRSVFEILQAMSVPSPIEESVPESKNPEVKAESSAEAVGGSKKHKKKKKSSSMSKRLSSASLDYSSSALKPSHITEAFRRYMSPEGFCLLDNRISIPYVSNRLLVA